MTLFSGARTEFPEFVFLKVAEFSRLQPQHWLGCSERPVVLGSKVAEARGTGEDHVVRWETRERLLFLDVVTSTIRYKGVIHQLYTNCPQ